MTSTRELETISHDATGRTLLGPLEPSLRARLVQAESAFRAGGSQKAILEEDLAAAVNYFGYEIGGDTYTGTNAPQVRLLRVAMHSDVPYLMSSPSKPPGGNLVANDMTPSGALFLGLLLLRQKLTNPAWFGDPDRQNDEWMKATATSVAARRPRAYKDTPTIVAIKSRLYLGLRKQGSVEAAAFVEFLTRAGFGR